MRARSDLAIAKSPLPEGALYEDLCFHAQQAAEKAIKAIYRANGLVFRYTPTTWRSFYEGCKRVGLVCLQW